MDHTGGGVAVGVFLLLWLVLGVVGIALSVLACIFWIWMLIDCLRDCPDADNKKLLWALVIIFTNWIGALLYMMIQRPNNPARQAF